MIYLVRTMFSQKPGFIETDEPLEKGHNIRVVKEYGQVPAVVVGTWKYGANELWGYGGPLGDVDLSVLEQDVKEGLGFLRHEGKSNLDIAIFAAEESVDRQTVQAYFVAEGRVDFRDLVRSFQRRFSKRLRLWQVGVRDRSQMVGGIGVCGSMLCCHAFLKDFESVSVNMAKEQGLLLNPDKITGTCGRLLCCLRYEHEWYCEAFSKMPDQGSRVKVHKDGQLKEVRLVTRNAVLGTAYVADDEGNMFWVDFEEIIRTCDVVQRREENT
ncbi:regulatory iron-sulfur-containing complex subunit RicT [Coprothermobacter platensis]|uniref:regulatory iron-sulfur-containing complex subunit RicT n=1 Tax=Coprothermobacter platensis TaxID=108819 RepID=UPI000361C1A8|nr:regulatory iron-sulfur-containing complex subunit RicT [Coprothermobacter platensis]